MMKILRIRLKSEISWTGDVKFPRLLTFGNLQVLKLIHPFLYHLLPFKDDQDHQPSISSKGLSVTSSNLYFCFSHKKGFEVPYDFTSGDFTKDIEKNLEILRYISKQSDMGILSTRITFLFRRILALPKFDLNDLHSFSSGGPPYDEKTSITLDMLSRLKCCTNMVIPVYATILLDAIRAYRNRDSRTAILYSMIALETALTTRFEEEYKRNLNKKKSPSFLRIQNVIVNIKNNHKKDSVYKYLMENAKFPQLLHEVPLYLLKRSLCIDDPSLYDRLLKHKEKRNQIAHEGNSDATSSSRKIALEVLEDTERAMKWLGIPEDFYVGDIGNFRLKVEKTGKLF